MIKRSFIFLLIASIIINVVFLYYFFNDKSKETSNTEKKDSGYIMPLYYELPDGVTKEQLIDSVIKTGDTILYENLCLYNAEYRRGGEFLPWALAMANKWKYKQAMYDVYLELTCLTEFNELESMERIKYLDTLTRNMALTYLINACKTSDTSNDVWRNKRYLLLKDYMDMGYIVKLDGNKYEIK